MDHNYNIERIHSDLTVFDNSCQNQTVLVIVRCFGLLPINRRIKLRVTEVQHFVFPSIHSANYIRFHSCDGVLKHGLLLRENLLSTKRSQQSSAIL